MTHKQFPVADLELYMQNNYRHNLEMIVGQLGGRLEGDEMIFDNPSDQALDFVEKMKSGYFKTSNPEMMQKMAEHLKGNQIENREFGIKLMPQK